LKNIIRWPFIIFFLFTILLLAAPYVQNEVYSQQDYGGLVPPEEFKNSCGPGMTDDVVPKRCTLLILEKYRHLLFNGDILTPVFWKTLGIYCNPLAENCNVKDLPNFNHCTQLITDDSFVCSKNWKYWSGKALKPMTNVPEWGNINDPPRWERPPSYEQLFPIKTSEKGRSLCTLSEIKQGFEAGKKAGHYAGMVVDVIEIPVTAAKEGSKAVITKYLTGVVLEKVGDPIGVMWEYGGGAAGAGLGGVFCGIEKLGNAYDKIKAYLGNQEEKRMAKLKLETKNWCYKYDYQEGKGCASLINNYYQCLAEEPPYTLSKGIHMFFIEGYLVQGKDPCWWKKDGPMTLPEGPGVYGNLRPHVLK
jgi:hypothetical protein